MGAGTLSPLDVVVGLPAVVLIVYGMFRLPGLLVRRISRAWYEGKTSVERR